MLAAAPSPIALSGVVVDSAGQPVAGASVWVAQQDDIRSIDTDDEGRFVFEGLRPAPAGLLARHEGHALASLHVPDTLKWRTVTLRLDAAASVRVLVVDMADRPVPGARVTHLFLSDNFHVPVDDLAAEGFPAIRGDDAGHLTIPNLASGHAVRFVVAHRDYADTMVRGIHPGDGESTVIMRRGVRLVGRVVDTTGKGVSGARVIARGAGSAEDQTAMEVKTDSEGFYAGRLVGGVYRLYLNHRDYAAPKPQLVGLREDIDPPIIDFIISRAGVVEGKVEASDGEAASGVLALYLVDGVVYSAAATNEEGVFHLDVPPGEGLVRIVPPENMMCESTEERVVAAEAEGVTDVGTFRLASLPVIEGAVLDPAGARLPNILIVSENIAPMMWTLSDESGCFQLQLHRAPVGGEVRFRLEHATEFLRGECAVDLRRPERPEVVLKPYEPDLLTPVEETRAAGYFDEVGLPAPKVVCDTWFNSGPMALEELLGKVVLLVFWYDLNDEATACLLDEVRALYTLLKTTSDVQILGIYVGPKESALVERDVAAAGLAFPVGCNAQYATVEGYALDTLPLPILIGKEGRLEYAGVSGDLLGVIKELRREPR